MLLWRWPGVEMAGAIAELTKESLSNEFTNFKPETSKIIIIEGSRNVLNCYPKELSKKQHNLKNMGIEID